MNKRRSLLVVAAFLWTATNSQLSAGEYHIGKTLVCSNCHIMHGSAKHDLRGGGIPFDSKVLGGPYAKLLRQNPNDLCISCHDGQTMAPDVIGPNSYEYVRQGGGLNDSQTVATHPENSGHTLGSRSTAPGGDWSNQTEGLLCIDCHAPHGAAGQFRNLWTQVTDSPRSQKFSGASLTYSVGVNNPSRDIFIDVSGDGLTGLERNYSEGAVWFNEPDTSGSSYGKWCASCHKTFHGGTSDPNMNTNGTWLRHPSAGVDIGAGDTERSSLPQYYSHTNRVKVMNPAGGIPLDGSTGMTPSCFSCHKAHGNKNAYGLIRMSGTGEVTEEGDTGGTSQSDLCRQCHVQ